MDKDNGTKVGIENGSGGVDPSRPIGPGNPPVATQFGNGQSIEGGGRPKGSKSAKTIMRAILNCSRKVKGNSEQATQELKAMLADYLGKEVDEVTNRELGLAMQANKMIMAADTAAATFCLKAAGELIDDVNVRDLSLIRLDKVNREDLKQIMTEIEDEC